MRRAGWGAVLGGSAGDLGPGGSADCIANSSAMAQSSAMLRLSRAPGEVAFPEKGRPWDKEVCWFGLRGLFASQCWKVSGWERKRWLGRRMREMGASNTGGGREPPPGQLPSCYVDGSDPRSACDLSQSPLCRAGSAVTSATQWIPSDLQVGSTMVAELAGRICAELMVNSCTGRERGPNAVPQGSALSLALVNILVNYLEEKIKTC